MTIKEFVEAVNALDNRDEVDAEVSPIGGVLLNKCGYLIAALGKRDTKWSFVSATHAVTIPTKILKLMVELAESREDDNRYVILNGKPFFDNGSISIRVFVINSVINEGRLSFATVSLDNLNNFAYSKEELEQLKSTLPEKLQDAVDTLTVTVSEAKKVLKNDD